MIRDIPTRDDFVDSGVTFLNLAWSAVLDLMLDLDESGMGESDDDTDLTDEYWARAQRPLATAVTLAQQGAEFLLKARIAETSPFLLLSASPRDWPKGCETSDASFSDFRTLDAQDLARVHDTVSRERLSGGFRSEFEQMRRVRNSLVHTVTKGQRFSSSDVLKWILRIHRELASQETWITYRHKFLESASPGGAFPDYYGCGYGPRVARELRATLDAFSPAECKDLLRINKKVRFYYCVRCHFHKVGLDSHVKTAQLRPNTPKSTSIYCHACDDFSDVVRTQCPECPGNVIDEDSSYCLTCGEC